jgi:hypothetical protein
MAMSHHPTLRRIVLLYDRNTGDVLDWLADSDMEAIVVVDAFAAPIIPDRCGRSGEGGHVSEH